MGFLLCATDLAIGWKVFCSPDRGRSSRTAKVSEPNWQMQHRSMATSARNTSGCVYPIGAKAFLNADHLGFFDRIDRQLDTDTQCVVLLREGRLSTGAEWIYALMKKFRHGETRKGRQRMDSDRAERQRYSRCRNSGFSPATRTGRSRNRPVSRPAGVHGRRIRAGQYPVMAGRNIAGQSLVLS